jgi:hypothetical protein
MIKLNPDFMMIILLIFQLFFFNDKKSNKL